MIRKKFNKLNNYVYEEVLENGLRIYICKIKRKNIFAEMTVLYGSKDTEFKKEEDKNFIKTYTGTAHFLEHLIYTKDGDFDPAEIYNKNSASHNAYTSKTVTAYHFYGPRNFGENLNTLLKCVTTLNITKKDVDKERNIIRQELLKYEDNPSFISDTKCLENTIIEDSYRYDTGGKASDLDKIDLKMIKTCFDYFYKPSNMFLVIAGNVNPEKVIKQVKEFYQTKKFENFNVIRKEYMEPLKVLKEKEIFKKDISNKYISINYKMSKPKIDEYKLRVYLNAFLTLKFGSLTKIYEDILKDPNYISDINFSTFHTKTHSYLNFEVTVQNAPEQVIKLIDDTLKDEEINTKYTEIYKKLMIKNLILDFENSSRVAALIESDLLKYKKVYYDIYSKIKSLDVLDFKEFIKSLDFSNRSYVIVEK